jgi:hypothetical protein
MCLDSPPGSVVDGLFGLQPTPADEDGASDDDDAAPPSPFGVVFAFPQFVFLPAPNTMTRERERLLSGVGLTGRGRVEMTFESVRGNEQRCCALHCFGARPQLLHRGQSYGDGQPCA